MTPFHGQTPSGALMDAPLLFCLLGSWSEACPPMSERSGSPAPEVDKTIRSGSGFRASCFKSSPDRIESTGAARRLIAGFDINFFNSSLPQGCYLTNFPCKPSHVSSIWILSRPACAGRRQLFADQVLQGSGLRAPSSRLLSQTPEMKAKRLTW